MNNWLIILALFGGVLLVSFLTWKMQDVFSSIKKYATALGVSFVLSLICIHLLPEIFHGNLAHPGIYILAGFVVQIILELFSKGIEHGHIHDGDHHHHHEQQLLSVKTLIPIIIGLCIHSLIEGIPIFLLEDAHAHAHHGHEHVSLAGKDFSLIFFWAIISHKLPVAIVLTLFLVNSKLKKSMIFLTILLFASMTPIGAMTGLLLESSFLSESTTNGLLAFTTGMLMHITTLLIFEEYHSSKERIGNIVLITIGLALGVITLI